MHDFYRSSALSYSHDLYDKSEKILIISLKGGQGKPQYLRAYSIRESLSSGSLQILEGSFATGMGFFQRTSPETNYLYYYPGIYNDLESSEQHRFNKETDAIEYIKEDLYDFGIDEGIFSFMPELSDSKRIIPLFVSRTILDFKEFSMEDYPPGSEIDVTAKIYLGHQ